MNIGRIFDCARFVVFAPLELVLVLFPSPAEVRAWAIAKYAEEERVAAERDSAAASPGTESDGVSTTAPVPGQPVVIVEPRRARQYLCDLIVDVGIRLPNNMFRL